MAKRATANKPAAKAAKVAAASPALPAANAPAQPQAEQGMTTPLSPAVSSSTPAETPLEVFGGLPPVVISSQAVVVTDVSGDTYEEGDIPPEIVVGSEALAGGNEPPADYVSPLSAEEREKVLKPLLDYLAESEPVAAPAVKFDSTHPAIALAQRFQAGSGRPGKRPSRYHTPEPPKLR